MQLWILRKSLFPIFFLLLISAFFSSASLGAACTKFAPRVTIRLQSGFPKKIKYYGTAAFEFADLVNKLSGGKIKVKIYQPNSVVKTYNIESTVGKGKKLNAAFTALGYVAHEHPAIELFMAVPFGPNPLAYASWMYGGDGLTLLNKYMSAYNIVAFPARLVPAEASGWFNKKIKKPADLKGLRFRAYGLWRPILRELGAKPVRMAADKLYAALKNGEIDGAEFSAPSVDSNLKLYEVAKYYYFPGWHQPATFLYLYFNKDFWKKLPAQYRSIIKTASQNLVFNGYIKMEAAQAVALKELKKRATIQKWSPQMLRLFYNAWLKVKSKLNKKDPNFNKIYQNLYNYLVDYNYCKKLNRSGYTVNE